MIPVIAYMNLRSPHPYPDYLVKQSGLVYYRIGSKYMSCGLPLSRLIRWEEAKSCEAVELSVPEEYLNE